MHYDLTNPCGLCPFRNDDKQLHVHPSRLREFYNGSYFVCHKTAVLNEDDDSGDYEPGENSQCCAGYLIMHEHLKDPSQLMRIAERLGMYDMRKVNMDAPVFRSWKEVREAEKQYDETKNLRLRKVR